MMPFAGNMNHKSSFRSIDGFINLDLHLKEPKDLEGYFSIKRYLPNYSHLFSSLKSKISEKSQQIKGKLNRECFTKNQKCLSIGKIRQRLNNTNK